MLDDPEDVIGACLQKLGFPFDSTEERQLQAARAEAMPRNSCCALISMPRCAINW